MTREFSVRQISIFNSPRVLFSPTAFSVSAKQIYIGGILTIASFEQRFGLVGEETLKGVIVGSYDLGCLLGALLTYPIGERIGRKRSILLGTTVMMIGAFLQFLAGNFGVMVAGRSVFLFLTQWNFMLMCV